ncbi:hypothetical protein GGR50DRAFT_360611 [Xylaria sp. CBS 124048]|nr:hypothetical protein GGR50DRAFT_360611 [Xylaria sp. CBS 124048]
MMTITALVLASLAPLALATFGYELPCSAVSGTPCRCPDGTDYGESVTMGIIGAPAFDVGALLNDFFDPRWEGLDPFMLQGPDNTPGLSIRDLNMTTSIGEYSFSERLTFRFIFPDGSFEQKSEQRGPVQFRSSNGSFAGLWSTIKGDRIFQNETMVELRAYACQTGHPMNFASYHESALKNATRLLAAGGKIQGNSTDPVSIQMF